MAEHKLSKVYNYQCLTKILCVFMWILTLPLIPFPSYSKSMENIDGKSKQYQRQPSLFIQMQICFLIKRKNENWAIYSQALIPMIWYFGGKKGLCIGMGWLPFQKTLPCLLRTKRGLPFVHKTNSKLNKKIRLKYFKKTHHHCVTFDKKFKINW